MGARGRAHDRRRDGHLALIRGSWGDEDWRVVGTSLGFAVFSAIGAAGLSLRLSGGVRADAGPLCEGLPEPVLKELARGARINAP
jgi:hypothetical protein